MTNHREPCLTSVILTRPLRQFPCTSKLRLARPEFPLSLIGPVTASPNPSTAPSCIRVSPLPRPERT